MPIPSWDFLRQNAKGVLGWARAGPELEVTSGIPCKAAQPLRRDRKKGRMPRSITMLLKKIHLLSIKPPLV